MDGGLRLLLAIGVLCLVVVPGLGSAQPEASYEVQGVAYYYAIGDVDAGHASLGPDPAAASTVPFVGCTWAKLRPDRDLGRINTIAAIDHLPVDIEFTEFNGTRSDMDGGVALDVDVDGSRTHGSIQHPRVHAQAAAWGLATLRVDGVSFNDPATGGSSFLATWFVTEQGFRDDETGRILNPDGSLYAPGDAALRGTDDHEMHLRIESLPASTRAVDVVYAAQEPPPGSTTMYMTPDEDHRRVHAVDNLRYGGNATFTVSASALAAEGENDLHFTVYSPDGSTVAEIDAAPSLLSSVEQTRAFPLDQLGQYVVEVDGPVSLSEYTITLTQEPPERFDLNMWWDNVTAGYPGLSERSRCEDVVEGQPLTGFVPLRPEPPGFPWTVTAMTVLGAIATVLVAVKFTMMAKAASAHRSATRD